MQCVCPWERADEVCLALSVGILRIHVEKLVLNVK